MSFLDHVHIVSSIPNRQCHNIWLILLDHVNHKTLLTWGSSADHDCLAFSKDLQELLLHALRVNHVLKSLAFNQNAKRILIVNKLLAPCVLALNRLLGSENVAVPYDILVMAHVESLRNVLSLEVLAGLVENLVLSDDLVNVGFLVWHDLLKSLSELSLESWLASPGVIQCVL